MARDYYRTNPRRIRLVDEFDRTYRPKEALHWSIQDSFPSYLLRHAFISCQSEQLNLCRFLIADTSRLIQQQSKRTGSLQLYRGMKLPSKLVDSFETHTGKIMCACGFFTCTKSRTTALELASSPGYRTDLSSVLFKIDCDVSVKLAEMSTEDRSPIVIFDVGTTFRIICVNRATISIIKMKAVPDQGKKLVQDYKNNHKGETIQTMLEQLLAPQKLSLSPPSKPIQPSSSSVQPLDSKPMISDDELQAENHIKNGKIDLAIAAYQRISPVSASIFVRIGHLYADKKGDYDNALNCYMQALKIQEERGEDTVDIITRIGMMHHERREFHLALQYHTRALKLCESLVPSNQASIATNLIGISNAHRARQELSEALDYAKRALAIRESMVPVNEVSIASSLATLANIYHDLGSASQARQVGMRAFTMFDRCLPANSPELAALLNNLGAIELSLGAIPQARQYFEQSLQIYREILPSEHPYLVKLENNLQCVTQMQQQAENNSKI
ncbi:unnamed protein product [Rotaria sp. Silwood1]|nr:unnamed protein product [Rotaria sp. Silwood1]